MKNSLFSDLPEPTKKGETDKDDNREDKIVDDDHDQIDHRATKRTKLDQPAPVEDVDQIALALLRIANHIQHRKKFIKASQLLRQLITSSPPPQPHHYPLIFDALCSSMKDLSSPHDPDLSMEYSRLFTLASKQKDMLSSFSEAQRAQLDVYGIHAVLCSKLTMTDDSFALSRVVKEIKELIEELPDVIPGTKEEEQEENALLLSSLNDDGDDNKNDKNTDTNNNVWSSIQCIAERRAAILSCILAGKDIYHKPWSKTTIDMLVDHVIASCTTSTRKESKFLSSQRKKLEEMALFIKKERMARSSGSNSKGSGGNNNTKEMTSFEKASADWSRRAAVSGRGKVGGGGDGSTMTWLG